MTLSFLSETFDVAGKILVAYTAISVHHRFLNEHKVDDKVFAVMKKEQKLGVFGIGLIIIGYILKIPIF